MSAFEIEALKQLTDQQVRFAPPARRLEQLARAERLLAEIDLGKNYPYQFVCFRITEYRPETYAGLVIPGGDLPVVWMNTKYRMIYMNMGHGKDGEKIYSDPIQNKLFANAVLWLGSRK